MSYDLSITGAGELDLDAARAVLGVPAGEDELTWERDALSATVVLDPQEIGIGVVADDAPREQRAREFEALLALVLGLAARLEASVHDHQLGRELSGADISEAVQGFA